MEYNVKELPKEEFLRLWDIVLIAREGVIGNHPRCRHPSLRRVSDRIEDFCDTDQRAISKPGYEGMHYGDGQIWVHRGQSYRDMQDTVLHELSHQEVIHEAHGKTWRKVFGTALALHLRECGSSWQEIRCTVGSNVVFPYRRFRTIVDQAEQTRIGRAEVQGIMLSAIRKVPILTQRGRHS